MAVSFIAFFSMDNVVRDWNERDRVLSTPKRPRRGRSRDKRSSERRDRGKRSQSRHSRGRPSRVNTRSRSPIIPNTHRGPISSRQEQRHSRQRSRSRSRSIPRGGSGARKSKSSDFINTFKEFIQVIRSEGASRSDERYPVLNVVPEFDPSKRNQTIDMWLAKVNECSSIYNWTERQTIHYALPKLTGLAQRWYQGLPSLLFSWTEWQDKLRTAFPSDENYGVLLTEMLEKRVKFGESLEEYFYEKMIMLNRCKISGKNAVDCILLGIDDRSVRTSAEAVQFTDPDKLLVFLRNVKINKRIERVPKQISSINDNRHPLRFNQNDSNRISERNRVKCYNCGEEGHPHFKCKLPIKKCDSCSRIGHVMSECPVRKGTGGTKDKTVL